MNTDTLAVDLFNQAFSLGMEAGMTVCVFVCVGCIIVTIFKGLG